MYNDCCVLRSYYDLLSWLKTKGKNPYRRTLILRLRVALSPMDRYYEIPVYSSPLLKPDEFMTYSQGKIYLNSFWFKNSYSKLSRDRAFSPWASYHCWGYFLYLLSICFDVRTEPLLFVPNVAQSLLFPYYLDFVYELQKANLSSPFYRSLPMAELAKSYVEKLSKNIIKRFSPLDFARHFPKGINSASITSYMASLGLFYPF